MKDIKRIIAKVLCLVLICTMYIYSPGTVVKADSVPTDSWVDPGNYTKSWINTVTNLDIYGNDGSLYEPYEIKSAKDLAGMSYYANAYKLDFSGKYINISTDTIDLAAHTWRPIGISTPFKGNFLGNGCTIKNMYIGTSDSYYTDTVTGFFGTSSGNISDIIIENVQIYAKCNNAGGLMGTWNGGSIKNCTVSGVINTIQAATNIGGLIGSHVTAGETLENCSTNVIIRSTVNGSVNNVGRFGGIIGGCGSKTNISYCTAQGRISTGTYCRVGGVIGHTTAKSSIRNCSTDVLISTGNNCCTGGILGYDDIDTTITNCIASGNLVCGSTSNVGGLIGYSDDSASVYTNCYAKGDAVADTASKAGGLIGYCNTATITQCGAAGNATIASGECGGFIGYMVSVKIYNSFSLGDAKAGSSSSVGGFTGVNNDTSTIENCYAAGATKAGSNSKLGGFSGNCVANKTSFKRCYWNKNATQTLDDVILTGDELIAVGYGTFTTIEGASETYMRTEEFAVDMNEYVTQSTMALDTWGYSFSLNNGYPYVSTMKDLFSSVVGGSEQVTLSENEDSVDKDMGVYGTFVFPEIPASEEPSTPDDPNENDVNISLEWGSLEYEYTSGEYDTETETFAEGTWAAKEKDVTDLIRVVNRSEVDIVANFTYIVSDADEGNYLDIGGYFEDFELGNDLSGSVVVEARQGAVEGAKNIRFGLTGAPREKVSNGTPTEIGKILLTLSKIPEEPEEVPTTEEPIVTEESEETGEAPMTEEPIATEEPEETGEAPTTEEPIATEEPEETGEAPTTEEPIATEEPEETGEAPTTEEPIATEEPEETGEAPTTEEPEETETVVVPDEIVEAPVIETIE